MLVSVTPFEIFKFAGGDKARRAQWKLVSEECQQIHNRVWQLFLQWHSVNGSVAKIKAGLEALAAWRAAGGDKETKPKPEVVAIGSELCKIIYRDVSDGWPDVHSRTRVLLLNRLVSGIRTRKACRGSLPGWINILFCREGIPSFTHPVPIPFDKVNSHLIPPDDENDNWRLSVKVERSPSDGHSLVDECELMTRKRKTRRIAGVLSRIAEGLSSFRGSYLVCDRGKWVAMICHTSAAEQANMLDSTRKAILMPGVHNAWVVKKNGMIRRRFADRNGEARHVLGMRRLIFGERQERQANYRWASSSHKGHGRGKATHGWEKLSSRWRDFVKRYNNEITTKLVKECVQDGIGTIEYYQPVDFQRDRRWLTGKDYRCGWDYFQVKTMLSQKCQRAGIVFTTKQIGAVEEGAKPATIPRKTA